MADIAGRYYNPAGRNIAGGLNDILNSISRRESGQVLRQREQQSMDIIDKQQSRKAMAEDAYMISELLKQNDVPGAEAVALDRIKAGMQAGKDMSHTQSLLQAIRQNPAEAQRDAALVVSKAEKFGYTSQRPTQFGSSSRYKDSEGNIYEVTQGRSPSTGKVETLYSPVSPGAPKKPVGQLQAMGASGLTSTEHIELAGGKKTAANEADLAKNVIDFGYDAARGMPILRRGIALLDLVKTGGWNAAALRAKQAFGIESANEGELAANLGKAVLSQLRATFGAAFTEKEGDRLAGIEAGMGKSVAANKRLLKQALSLGERYVKDAIKRARKNGDNETVAELESWLSADLGQMMEAVNQVQPAGGEPAAVNWSDM